MISAVSLVMYPAAHGNGHGEYTETWSTSSSTSTEQTHQPSADGGIATWVQNHPVSAVVGGLVVTIVGALGLAYFTASVLAGGVVATGAVRLAAWLWGFRVVRWVWHLSWLKYPYLLAKFLGPLPRSTPGQVTMRNGTLPPGGSGWMERARIRSEPQK